MNASPLKTILELLRASALVEERFTGTLSAVHGLSLTDLLLMHHVQQSRGSKLSRVDLARRIHVSASTVTRKLIPLEKIGLVGREADARDARLVYVVLTPAGETLLGHASDTLEHMSERVFQDRWPSGDISKLETLLGRIQAAPDND